MTQTSINIIQQPNQSLSVNLTDDNGNVHIADINLRTMYDGFLIMDLIIDDKPQFYGRRCINRMPLLLNRVIQGNLYFYDLFGNSDPVYTEFNDRYVLIYDTEYNLQ